MANVRMSEKHKACMRVIGGHVTITGLVITIHRLPESVATDEGRHVLVER
jgi:hypothetical protein